MNVVVGFLAGVVAVRLLVGAARDLLAHPMLGRTNVRGRVVPTAGGLYPLIAVVAVAGGWAFVDLLTDRASERGAWLLGLVVALGFGLLGFVDDVLGGDDAKGFRGHVRALRHGRVTTGFVKLAGGGAIALVAALALAPRPLGVGEGIQVMADAVLVALGANLGNLFDRAPGRVLKVGALVAVPLAIVAGTAPVAVPVAVVLGAALGVLPDDLSERLMLGDTGANMVGAMLALGAVASLGPGARQVVLAIVLALNVASERVSFSRVITRTPPLAWLDGLGRRR